MAPPRAPTVGRPAQGFSTERAQRWILGAAVLTAVVYVFRRLVEPAAAAAPARGGKTASLLGSGSPPPALGQWAVAYGAGFTMLAMVALFAPEIAGSLALMVVAGTTLTNGMAIAADLAGLQHTKPPATPATKASAAHPPPGATGPAPG